MGTLNRALARHTGLRRMEPSGAFPGSIDTSGGGEGGALPSPFLTIEQGGIQGGQGDVPGVAGAVEASVQGHLVGDLSRG